MSEWTPTEAEKRSIVRILLEQEGGHPVLSDTKPSTCEQCPLGAKTREPDDEIWNDRSEAHYICPVVGKEVWGENPECGPAFRRVVGGILAEFIKETEEEKTAREAEERRKADELEAKERAELARLLEKYPDATRIA